MAEDECCDDGNDVDDDGCSAVCAVEDRFTCTNTLGATSTCDPKCGDGRIVPGEACDDGDLATGEGCLDDCTGEEDGWSCSGGDWDNPDVCDTVCGDNYIRDAEECEDGNTANLDGCDSDCMEEPGWTFSTTTNGTGHDNTVATPVCDDGRHVDGEICDDGPSNFGSGEGCLDDCLGENDGWYCSGGDENNPDSCSTQCGDNYI